MQYRVKIISTLIHAVLSVALPVKALFSQQGQVDSLTVGLTLLQDDSSRIGQYFKLSSAYVDMEEMDSATSMCTWPYHCCQINQSAIPAAGLIAK